MDGLQSPHHGLMQLYNILSIKTLFSEEGVEEKEAIPAWKPLVRVWCPACSVEGEGGEALLLITCFSIGP